MDCSLTSEQVVERHCPACTCPSAESTTLPYGNAQWPIKQCQQCGFVYLSRAPVYDRLSEEFAWEQTSEAERAAREHREPKKQAVSRWLKKIRREVLKRDKLGDLIQCYAPQGNILDIGCAGGGFLARLGASHVPHGIEISKQLAQAAQTVVKPRNGQIMHENALNGVALFPEKRFQCVVMSSFLEHEIEPLGLLKGTARILSKDGVTIIKVPNYASLNRHVRASKWCGFRLPDHVNYFTPTSLVGLIESAGLEVRQFDWKDHHTFSDNMWMVASKGQAI